MIQFPGISRKAVGSKFESIKIQMRHPHDIIAQQPNPKATAQSLGVEDKNQGWQDQPFAHSSLRAFAAVTTQDRPPILTNSSAVDEPPEDMSAPDLIGRTIKLVRADNWREDIIETPPKETYILYENQRGYTLQLNY
jgi:hypothetical protein